MDRQVTYSTQIHKRKDTKRLTKARVSCTTWKCAAINPRTVCAMCICSWSRY